MEKKSHIMRVLGYLAFAIIRFVFNLATSCWRMLRDIINQSKTPVQKLRSELWRAKSVEEWTRKAHELDLLLGNDAWREDETSPYYDYGLIKHRLIHLRNARRTNDVAEMIYLLRAGLLRNLGGINDPRLFERSFLGTKKLIQDYTNEVVQQLEYLADTNIKGFPQSKIEIFHDTRQSYGCSALVLHGGATFGLYHLGVCKALHENGLLPRIISGNAIGALIAALVCIRTDEELPEIFTPDGIDLNAFSRVGQKGNIRRKIIRLFTHGYLMDVKVLQDCVKSNVGDLTFEEAYTRTHRILNITVTSTRKDEVPQLLNYLTAPNVLIWSAALASTSMLGLYQRVELLAKDDSGATVNWVPSGEIKWTASESVSPFQRISELFNVNNFIVSQAIPYIAPFIPKEPMSHTAYAFYKCAHFIHSEFKHRVSQLEYMGLLPSVLRIFVDDKVSGNVTIVPQLRPNDFKALFSNPTPETVGYWILKGEQSTWPVLAMIKNRCIIDLALDRILLKLKAGSIDRSLTHPDEAKEKNAGRKRTKSMH